MFNFLDSAACCNDRAKPENGVAVGEILDENNAYQFWNIIGHILPGLFLALYFKKRLEYFISGIFVSSALMYSPLWGCKVTTWSAIMAQRIKQSLCNNL